MKKSKLIYLVLMFMPAINSIAGDIDYDKLHFGTDFRFGIKTLNVKSLNNTLSELGLAKINPLALEFYVGVQTSHHNWLVNTGFTYLNSRNKEDIKISTFSSWGFSADFAYRICGNDKMGLYPYFGLTLLNTLINTQEQIQAGSFSTVYDQPTTDRTFLNGEIDGGPGLLYRLFLGKRHKYIGIRAGYDFRIWQGKWRYAGNKIIFPATDCRGWNVSILFSL